jgi:hypothetical protein
MRLLELFDQSYCAIVMLKRHDVSCPLRVRALETKRSKVRIGFILATRNVRYESKKRNETTCYGPIHFRGKIYSRRRGLIVIIVSVQGILTRSQDFVGGQYLEFHTYNSH